MAETSKPRFVFKKANEKLIAWPCTIAVPMDGGGFQDQLVTARFKVMDGDAFTAFAKQGDKALLSEVVDGFVEFNDEAGRPAPDADAKALLFSLPYAVAGLVAGYMEMIGRRLSKN